MLGLAFLVIVGMVTPVRPASADPPAASLDVFVGYADTLRANPAQFPTPWSGAPGVHFAGCTVNCSFDAGAARFVNHSPLPVTVDSVHIRLSTCDFDMWPHGTVLQPEEQLIVTQTATGAADGCNNAAGFFDTSDIGPNGTEWAGHCDQSGVIPQIDVSINGVVSTFTDAGQVLNTGGIDLAACPAGTNESTQWTLIGSEPCPGATLTLAPPTQNQGVGSPATVQATLKNSCGTGLQGAPITFSVISGPNAGTTGSGVTDSTGVASFSYTSGVTGTDTLRATTVNPAGTISSNTVTVTWEKIASFVHFFVNSYSTDFNDPIEVQALLGDRFTQLDGRTLTFVLNGTETCSAVTDFSGVAGCTLNPQEPAGTYTLTASFAGDATHNPSSASVPFIVTLEETTLTYTGPTKAANGQPLTLSGVLKEDGATPIAGRTVTFTIGSGASAQSCAGTTNGAGQASCTIAVVNQPAASTTVPVTAVFAGDPFYRPASDSATLRFLFLTGRAYGLSSNGLVGIAPIPDTGQVSTAVATTVAPPCVATISGLISAHTLCARVDTTVNPGSSSAAASVQDARIGVLGLPVIQVGLVRSASRSDCGGSSGEVTITSISVGGVAVPVDLHPGPNTSVTVLGISLTFNEQLPVPRADHGLTVNAVHIKAAGLLDVVLASSTSDIHNC